MAEKPRVVRAEKEHSKNLEGCHALDGHERMLREAGYSELPVANSVPSQEKSCEWGEGTETEEAATDT